MSEYQYYEFQAVDRRLTGKEMEELRAVSTRARITPTSFVNAYSWGDFKGDIDAWMDKYFDAFLYLANWGTHLFKLRLPARVLAGETARLYCAGDSASVREKNGKIILSFGSDDEEEGGWVEEDEAAGQLASIIPMRAELARGDLRALYLAWLLCAQSGELDDDDLEPPVPAGLADLTPALESFVEFLRIDIDLVAAAAAASPPLAPADLEPADVRAWLAKLAIAEKDELLARLIVDNDASLTDELVQRMRREREGDHGAGAKAGRRTVAELLRAGELAAAERKRIAAEKAAKEKVKRERAAALARAKHLDQLAGREQALWAQVHSLVATLKPKSYDQATELLVDLRDLAVRTDADDFRERLDALRHAHAGKRTFIERLSKAGL